MLHTAKDSKLSSLLDSDVLQSEFIDSEKITMQRLDEFLPAQRVISDQESIFLKMDTQGFDLEVFAGSKNLLKRIKGLMTEVSVKPLYNNMVNYKYAISVYENSGYSLTGLSIVAVNHNKEILELNCLFKKDVLA